MRNTCNKQPIITIRRNIMKKLMLILILAFSVTTSQVVIAQEKPVEQKVEKTQNKTTKKVKKALKKHKKGTKMTTQETKNNGSK
jgi:hypothetical protein